MGDLINFMYGFFKDVVGGGVCDYVVCEVFGVFGGFFVEVF